MIRYGLSSFLLAAVLACGFPAWAANSAIVSTMRNVNAVKESRGFYLARAEDRSGGQGFGSLAPIQAFELIRPNNRAVTIGRLYTSCTCVEASLPKRTFAAGERVIIELKNVRLTPPNGQMYAIYVQVTSPVRATLRIDTMVQSSQFVTVSAPEPAPSLAAVGEEPADESAIDRAVEEARDAVEEAVALSGSVGDAVGGTADAVADEAGKAVEEAEKTISALAAAARDDAAAEDDDAARPASAGNAAVEQRISTITLGVADLTRAREFYEAVGWKPASRNKYDGMVFFQLNGVVMTLYPMPELLRDQGREDRDVAGGGLTLGYNVREKAEVRVVYDAFIKAGGESIKEPEELPWGSVVAYVADIDGHPWEISWVPQMSIDADGGLSVD